MTRTIRFDPEAADGIAWFRRYYRDTFPEGASSAADRLQAILSLLVDQPEMGAPYPDRPNVRLFVIPKTPFSLAYLVTDDAIVVIDLLDQRSRRAKAIHPQ
ncbi:MAG: type II toxin-antitoxin system RelE/ParE family toxin [Pseudomonadota bacterium]